MEIINCILDGTIAAFVISTGSSHCAAIRVNCGRYSPKRAVDKDEKIVYDTIKDVYESLEERGYNPINKIVGYIISGDLGYISSYKEARNKISKLDRNTIVEVLLKNYLK